jgi:hypothetical protein
VAEGPIPFALLRQKKCWKLKQFGHEALNKTKLLDYILKIAWAALSIPFENFKIPSLQTEI